MRPQGRGLSRQEEAQEKGAAVGTGDNDGEGGGTAELRFRTPVKEAGA